MMTTNNNKHSIYPMPMVIIDTCSSDDKEELINSKLRILPRSFSLLDYDDAYKDLSGTIHYSSNNHFTNFLIRSYSCPNNYLSRFHSSLIKLNFNINLLDPSNGIHSPEGSSSRYSLYGSFFDLSETSYHSSFNKTDNNKLLSINTYQDKCKNWLKHLNIV